MSAGRQHVTFTNMQRDLEASEARHLDLARRYDARAARLAEVEEELLDLKAPDPEADQWRRSEETAREVESRRMEAELRSAREQRDKAVAERDRLAQELEDALGHLRAVLDAWDPMAENYEMGPFFEAREFLARFPLKEGDEFDGA